MTTTKTIPIITTSITTSTIKTIPIMTTIITIPRAIITITITVINTVRKEQPYKCNDIIITRCYRSK